MTFARHIALIACFTVTSATGATAVQEAAPVPALQLTPEEMEQFLLTAKIVSSRPVGEGTTNSRRATLSDGRITHDAHLQVIDESRAVYRVMGYTELNFRDCYCYNIAAYQLARLLGIDNVPMSVERSIGGQRTAVTWWVDDVMMDEETRRKKNVVDPDPARSERYVNRQRVFDELIQNRDRNLGNLLYTSGWTMWMIDHTRAFRLGRSLLRPELLLRIDRTLFDNLRKLNEADLAKAVGKSLNRSEIEAVLARRDAIVALFESRIAKLGEARVLY